MLKTIAAWGGVVLCCAAIVGCGSSLPRVSPELVASARRDWPEATESALNRGRRLYTTRCNTCHILPLPAEYQAQVWPGIVRSMALRSKLDRDGQDDVLHFILAARPR